MLVATEDQRALRRLEMDAEDRDAALAAEAAKKNREFVQVYPKGWRRLQDLIQKNPPAARVYAFLAEHIDGVAGAVAISQDVMADALGVHVRTIQRQTKFLEDAGALVRIKVGVGVYAYALDPNEIWKSWDDRKEHAAFVTKTLVKKSDAANREVRRKLKVMLGEPELPL
jgi:DNA-binding transcriptional regulator YhcF (GntR family)